MKMEKEHYIQTELDIIFFEKEDIIVTSSGGDGGVETPGQEP